MAASCGDLGGDLVGGIIDSMDDEETAKFALSLEARLQQIEDESASHNGIVEEEGVRCNDMAALCGDHGGDLVGGAIDSMDDEETAKFILSFGATLQQIEDESASHEGIVEEEGVRCDDMAALCGDHRGDLVGGAIKYMTDEETAKFILDLEAMLKQM